MAENEEAARDAVEADLRDGYKIEDYLGVAPESQTAKYELTPGVPELFHGRV